MAPIIVNIAFPIGVDVSRASWYETKSMQGNALPGESY